MLVDSHCHLDFDNFDEDRDETIQRAFENNVKLLVTICTHYSKFKQVLSVAAKDPRIFCSVGTHPHHVEEEVEVTVENLTQAAENPKVIGIGETGLDFYYQHSSRKEQEKSFRTHIEASRITQLPLIVHSRDADQDMIRILTEETTRGTFPCVLHCFSSGKILAEIAIELGFYLSLSGILTFKNAEELRCIIRNIPLDKLLLETDSPFLAPVPKRGKRNEPSFIIYTAQKGADIKELNLNTFIKTTTDNFFRLFSKAYALEN
ncbi:MAG: LuxR family transcriptional regulator [Rhodospirillales bacterium]|nr:LuxR family transcriptional regulator [Rhodospirillales bacterium]